MSYREHLPPVALAPYVDRFWSRDSDGAGVGDSEGHRVLPDGCLDIVARFEGDACEALGVGAMTRALVVAAEPGVRYVGVRFRPGMARLFVGVPAVALTDERVPLLELDAAAPRLAGDLADATSLEARLHLLTAHLFDRLRRFAPPARHVALAVARLEAAHGAIAIADLADDLGVTRQHLARGFLDHVGVSPKVLSRILRVRRLLDLASSLPRPDWAGLACDAGFYDQSHLTAEVKAITGLTPSSWATRR